MVRRRIERYETKTGHERWLVSYSDFVTLLFGFFVVMYSVSHVSEQKYRVLSTTLASAFEGKVPVDKSVQNPMQTLQSQNHSDQGAIAGLSPFAAASSSKMIAVQIQESLLSSANPDNIAIRATEEWVEIEINAKLLFASGKAEPSDEAQEIFRRIAAVLASVPNEVEVSGHTDDQPIQTAQFKSNWELSAARAASVVRLLAQGGVEPARMAAVGYGEFRPVADNQTEPGRAENRRVVVTVARHVEANALPSPMQMFNPSDLSFSAPNNAPETGDRTPDVIEPVRLNSGGLLFSRDPDLPRQRN